MLAGPNQNSEEDCWLGQTRTVRRIAGWAKEDRRTTGQPRKPIGLLEYRRTTTNN